MASPLLALLLLPQIVPDNAEAILVDRAVVGGRIQTHRFELGRGGVRDPRAEPVHGRGSVRTPGGVLVRAQTEGVKLDFVGGGELLYAPDGRLHVRSGEATLAWFHGVRLLLGDGSIVTIRRRFPKHRVVVLTDALAASMRKLPEHAPRKSVQFPQVAEAARRFAALSDLFRGNICRPPGAVGELWFPMRDRYRLKLEARDNDVLVAGLYREGSDIPGLEWTFGYRSEVHFVRPAGGRKGGPRYFLRGLEIDDLIGELVPGAPRVGKRATVADVVRRLGTPRGTKKLPVRRVDRE